MESRLSASLGLPSPNPDHYHSQTSNDFLNLFTHFTPAPTSHIPFFASTTTTTTQWASKSRLPKPQFVTKSLSVFERTLIGAGCGRIAGAFTDFCLHPFDTIKTKLQTKGASEIYLCLLLLLPPPSRQPSPPPKSRYLQLQKPMETLITCKPSRSISNTANPDSGLDSFNKYPTQNPIWLQRTQDLI